MPPPGFVFDRLHTGRMVAVEIHSRSDIPAEQYWEVPPEPVDYRKKRNAERHKQKSNPDYDDKELTVYSNREWFRRMNGFWFMNNGVATYITGVHYFYLAHWTLNTGKVSFRWGDLQYFYFWASAFEDPKCLGICNYANRQQGKSFRAGVVLFDIVSRTESALGGIQSKGKDDAADFFTKCVTTPVSKLKDFWLPIYDKQLGLTAKSRLRFFRKSKTGDRNDESDDDIEPLNSEIDFRDSSASAYDGTTLKICIQDEFGKLDAEHSLLERHRTLRPAIISGGGKMLYCTTVEDMASGKNIKESKELWDTSDPKDRLDNGRTPSGLYRFWLPAYESPTEPAKYDKYGMPKIEEARQELMSLRNYYLFSGDFRGYASECRKNPFTVSDVFRVAAKAPIWDIIRIGDQLSYLAVIDPKTFMVQGNFVWHGAERDTRVKFVPMKNGRFSVHSSIIKKLELEEQNLRRPINKHRFVSGCDPIEQKFAETPSKAATYGYSYPDIRWPELDNWLFLEYYARPQPSIFFEDMVMMCVFFGMQLNVENNLNGLIDYIERRGYGAFLYWQDGAKKAGTYSSTESKDKGAALVGEYVNDFCQFIPFSELLEDMAMFDLSDSTKRDRSMALIMTMLAIGNRNITPREQEKTLNVTSIIKRHKIRR